MKVRKIVLAFLSAALLLAANLRVYIMYLWQVRNNRIFFRRDARKLRKCGPGRRGGNRTTDAKRQTMRNRGDYAPTPDGDELALTRVLLETPRVGYAGLFRWEKPI
jgi:hypothetical protein